MFSFVNETKSFYKSFLGYTRGAQSKISINGHDYLDAWILQGAVNLLVWSLEESAKFYPFLIIKFPLNENMDVE